MIPRRTGLALAALIAISAAPLWADGGATLLRTNSGPYVITLFGSPTPLRTGPADLSVMVQNAAGQSAVLDAHVMVRLKKAQGGDVVEVAAPATHEKATNKLLYAASLTVPSDGVWHVSVDVNQAGKTASVFGEVKVLPPQPPLQRYWPYLLIVPVIALLFALNQALRRRRGIKSPRVRP